MPNFKIQKTILKIHQVDQHIYATYAGLQADSRVLINKARVEAQNYRMQMDDAPTVEYVARAVANYQQKFTQKGGSRPFGVSMLMGGFDPNKNPRLFQCDPNGSWTEWKAQAVGRNSKSIQEYLVKGYVDDMDIDRALVVVLRGMLEVVESKNNVEISVFTQDYQMINVTQEKLTEIMQIIEQEKQAEADEKKPILQ